MAYTTQADMIKASSRAVLIKLTDDNNTGDIVTEVIDWAIDTAQKEIDVYLKGRYPDDMEDADVPAYISDVCTTIALCKLYGKKLMLTMPEALKMQYKQAVSYLKDVQTGKITPFPAADEPDIIVGKKTSDDKIFNSTLMGTYPTLS